MSRFVEEQIARAGLLPVLRARRAGDFEKARSDVAMLDRADLLALGAVADAIRVDEIGQEVRVHATAAEPVTWIHGGATDLDVLRAVAIARITGARAARVGVDWADVGLELAQVALGFGVSDLCGPLAKKSGLPILESEARKVKGQGMVALAGLKKREIELLVRYAGRIAGFDDEAVHGTQTLQEAAGA